MPKAEKKPTLASVQAEIARMEKRRDAAHLKMEEAKNEETSCIAQIAELKKELDALRKEDSKGKLESAFFKTYMTQEEIDQAVAALATALKNPKSRKEALTALQAVASNAEQSTNTLTNIPKEE